MYGVSEIVVNSTPVASAGLTMLSARDASGWTAITGGSRSNSGVRVTPMSAMGYPPLWRAINLVSDRLACLPFDCFKRDGEDRSYDPQHPANALMRGDANEWTHGETIRKTLTAHAMLYGNGFAAINRDGRSKPVELLVLDPSRTGMRMMDSQLWYWTWIDNEEVKIPARDILHIKGLSHDGIAGISVITVMKDALGVGMAAQEFGGRYFGQGSNAGGLLMIPGSFSEEKIRNTISAWEQMTSGLQKSHKVALLQDGAKFQQLTINNNEAQFLETRQFEIRSTVANIFGIPPHKLGDDSRTSHNSLEAEDQSFLDDCLNPWLKEWERECRRKLLSDRERKNDTHFFEFNREAVVQMEYEKKINGIYRLTEMGAITPNEGRRMLNMPDVGPEGDKRFHPANWVEYGKETPNLAPNQPANPAQNDPETPPNEPENKVLRAMIGSSVTNALRIEADRIVRAAKQRTDFCGSLDGIYQTWTETFSSNIGWQSPETVVAIARHTEESKRQLLDVAGVATSATLETHVRELVACWADRGDVLTENLMKAVQ